MSNLQPCSFWAGSEDPGTIDLTEDASPVREVFQRDGVSESSEEDWSCLEDRAPTASEPQNRAHAISSGAHAAIGNPINPLSNHVTQRTWGVCTALWQSWRRARQTLNELDYILVTADLVIVLQTMLIGKPILRSCHKGGRFNLEQAIHKEAVFVGGLSWYAALISAGSGRQGDSDGKWWYRFPDFVPLSELRRGINPR